MTTEPSKLFNLDVNVVPPAKPPTLLDLSGLTFVPSSPNYSYTPPPFCSLLAGEAREKGRCDNGTNVVALGGDCLQSPCTSNRHPTVPQSSFTPINLDNPELASINANVSKPPAKKPARKKPSNTNPPPVLTQSTGNPAIMVANLGQEHDINAEPDPGSIHDFEIKEDLFTPAELALNPLVDVFVKGSKITNDELVKYYIIKYRIMEYKCTSKSCPMKGAIWRRRPAYLILCRKNNRQNDLSITNLSLICPNCYVQDKGSELFNNFRTKNGKKCISCAYPVKDGFELCFVCTEKMKKIGALKSTDDYAELTVRTIQNPGLELPYADINTYTHISNKANEYVPSTRATLADIDKEFAELGVGFSLSSSSKSTGNPAVNNGIGIDIDAELAKYKEAIETDIDSITPGGSTSKKSKSTPSSVIHYTKHRAGQTGSNSQSKLNLAVTQELLDALADI